MTKYAVVFSIYMPPALEVVITLSPMIMSAPLALGAVIVQFSMMYGSFNVPGPPVTPLLLVKELLPMMEIGPREAVAAPVVGAEASTSSNINPKPTLALHATRPDTNFPMIIQTALLPFVGIKFCTAGWMTY